MQRVSLSHPTWRVSPVPQWPPRPRSPSLAGAQCSECRAPQSPPPGTPHLPHTLPSRTCTFRGWPEGRSVFWAGLGPVSRPQAPRPLGDRAGPALARGPYTWDGAHTPVDGARTPGDRFCMPGDGATLPGMGPARPGMGLPLALAAVRNWPAERQRPI